MLRRLVLTCCVIAGAAGPAFAQTAPAPSGAPADAQTRTLNLSAYAELLRSDLRTQRIAVLTEMMGFTEAEDKAFWPIYREYDAAMTALGDERVALIAEYARQFETMTDDAAAKLAAKAIDLDGRRRAALAAVYEKVKAATSPRTALRFLQIEHQLQLLTDLQISAALPIAK